MNDEEKDLFIKGKLKNGKIPEKIDNLFNSSLKFIENKGVDKMENKGVDKMENNNGNMGQIPNMNQYQNMNSNNPNNNGKKKMPVAAKRIIATAACLTLLLGGGNIYASTQGYDNIFFLIGEKLGLTKDAFGKDEILSDRDITISYRAIEISPGTSIQINSLVIKDNTARLKIQVDETLATVGITPLMYKVKDENGNQLCNTISNYSKSEGTESQFKEELLLKGFKNDTKKLTLEIYDYSVKKLVDLEIDLENKKIDVIGNQEEVKKISEEELKKYLGAFAALNYNEVMNIDYQDPVTVNFAENTTKINNTKKLMVAEQIAKIKGINIYYEVSHEGEKLETARIIPEKIHEVIKSFTTLELNEENILETNEDVYMYSKSGSQGTAAAGKPLYYRYPSTSNRSYLAPTCLEVTDISYIGGIYNVAFKFCYSTTLDKGFEQSANIEDLPVYEMSMGLILDENNQYSKYRISSMSKARLVEEKDSVSNNNTIKIEGEYRLVGNDNSEGLTYTFEGNTVTFSALYVTEGTYEIVGDKIKIIYTKAYDIDGELETFPNGQEEELTIVDENTLTSQKIRDGVVYNGKYVKTGNETTENNKEEAKYKGTWNTESIYSLTGEEVSLVEVLGSGYTRYGSKLILNEDGTFENYIQPIQSNEFSNTGKWKYYDEDLDVEGVGYVSGKIVLKYDDKREEELQVSTGRDSQAVLIYLMGNDYRLHLYNYQKNEIDVSTIKNDLTKYLADINNTVIMNNISDFTVQFNKKENNKEEYKNVEKTMLSRISSIIVKAKKYSSLSYIEICNYNIEYANKAKSRYTIMFMYNGHQTQISASSYEPNCLLFSGYDENNKKEIIYKLYLEESALDLLKNLY